MLRAGVAMTVLVAALATLVTSADAQPAHLGGVAIDAAATTLYVGAGDQLKVYDLADPSQPVLLAQTGSLGAAVRDVTASQAVVAVLLDGGGIVLLDVSDRQQPTPVGNAQTAQHTREVVALDRLLLVPDGSVLRILDISTPESPADLAAYDPPGDVLGVAAAGGMAYVVTSENALRTLDVSDPAHPGELGATRVLEPGYLLAPAILDHYAFTALIFGRYTASLGFDVADPAHPTRSSAPVSLYGAASLSANDLVLIAADGTPSGPNAGGSIGVIVLDATGDAFRVGSLQTDWTPVSLAAGPAHAYVLGTDGIVRVVDVSDPTQPVVVGTAT
jgi:hypothetical protein